MIKVLVSGEGKTDMGELNYPDMEPANFNKGPMTCLAEQIIKQRTGEFPHIELIAKKTLTQKAKSSHRMKLPGKKSRQKTAFFYKNAYILGQIALEKQYDIAILFRDTDGTQSSSPSNWKERADSIHDGFKASGFQNGVAMVPKPTSEAWILCCLQKYQNCEKLEKLRGNENSSKHPKKIIEQITGSVPTMEFLVKIACEDNCDTEQIDMPSFNAFKTCLEKITTEIENKQG